jgi:hypothetical protein
MVMHARCDKCLPLKTCRSKHQPTRRRKNTPGLANQVLGRRVENIKSRQKIRVYLIKGRWIS